MRRRKFLYLCLLAISLIFSGCGSDTKNEKNSTKNTHAEKNEKDGKVKILDAGIKIKDYVEYSFDGFNHLGTAKIRIDWGKIVKEKKIEYTDNGKKEYQDTEVTTAIEELCDYQVSNTEYLSNGDEIKVTFNNSPDFKEVFGVKLDKEPLILKVEGLKETETFDAFEKIEMNFEGASPFLTVNFKDMNTKKYFDEIVYDKSKKYCNGEEIKVTLKLNNPAKTLSDVGALPETCVKTYKIENAGSYILSYDDLTDEQLQKLIEGVKNTYYEDYKNGHFDNNETRVINSIDYVGSYIFTPREKDGSRNNIVIVYKCNLSLAYKTDYGNFADTFDYYFAMNGKGVYLTDENEKGYDCDSDFKVIEDIFEVESGVSSFWYSNYTWSLYGSRDLTPYSSAVNLFTNTKMFTFVNSAFLVGINAEPMEYMRKFYINSTFGDTEEISYKNKTETVHSENYEGTDFMKIYDTSVENYKDWNELYIYYPTEVNGTIEDDIEKMEALGITPCKENENMYKAEDFVEVFKKVMVGDTSTVDFATADEAITEEQFDTLVKEADGKTKFFLTMFGEEELFGNYIYAKVND